jgi:hypothetical protein
MFYDEKQYVNTIYSMSATDSSNNDINVIEPQAPVDVNRIETQTDDKPKTGLLSKLMPTSTLVDKLSETNNNNLDIKEVVSKKEYPIKEYASTKLSKRPAIQLNIKNGETGVKCKKMTMTAYQPLNNKDEPTGIWFMQVIPGQEDTLSADAIANLEKDPAIAVYNENSAAPMQSNGIGKLKEMIGQKMVPAVTNPVTGGYNSAKWGSTKRRRNRKSMTKKRRERVFR